MAKMSGPTTRVLYYIAYPQRMAGANRSLFELVTNLPDSVRPFVILAGEGEAAEAYRAAGLEPQIISPGHSLGRYGYNGALLGLSHVQKLRVAVGEYLPYILKLKNVINSLKIDIVHTNDVRGTLLAGLAARLAGCPVVGHIRAEKNPFSSLVWHIYELIPTRFITVSTALQASLSRRAQARSTTIYNGIQDITQQAETIPVWLSELRAQGKTIVCCFASVVPFKGYHHLLEAVVELNKRGYQRKAIFVCVGAVVPGYQTYADWLKHRQQELKIDNLYFTGWQANPFPFYKATDIAVLPSVSREQLCFNGQTIEVYGGEGFPRTHLEAMCFGLPIVGTEIAGVREQIVDGLNGFVVPPSDKAALAAALERLLSDAALRAQMGQAGRKRVLEHFSTATYVTKVMDVYASVMPRHTGHN